MIDPISGKAIQIPGQQQPALALGHNAATYQLLVRFPFS